MNMFIAPSKKLGFSNIYLDFLAQASKVKQFYPAGSIEEAAEKNDRRSYPRDAMVDILTNQNKTFGATQPVFDNIELLRDTKTICVFTGQQAGLFGGSLLVIIKALAIVKAARKYSQQLNRPVIPIFWIAGDDHDYEEVNHTYLMDRSAEIVKVQYETKPEYEYSTSELLLQDEEELEKAKTLLKNTLGETDFTSELYELIENSYTKADTYVSAFGKLMSKLTSEFGLVLFSPGDKKAKAIAAPLIKEIILKQDDLHAELDKTKSQIQQDGYHIQVEKKDNSTHLFYNMNGRKALLRHNNNFKVDENVYTKDELLAMVDAEPEKFSPDVMTRPLMQSYLFPVISQKGGAAEIAYLAQIHKLFDLFDLPTPFYKGRPTATIVEKRYEKLMKENQINFEEIVADIEQVINRVLMESFPENIEEKFQTMRNHIKCHFEDFADESLHFDQSLEKFSQQIMGKIDFNLQAFEGKIFSAHKKKSKESRERIYKLWHSLYPNRTFQERVINISYFISRYGFDFVKFLYDSIDCEDSRHQLIYLSEKS